MILGYGHTALSMSESAQREALAEADEIWMEKCSLAIPFLQRPVARQMLSTLRAGDVLRIIHAGVLIDRRAQARTQARRLRQLLRQLGRYGLTVRLAMRDFELPSCLPVRKTKPDFVTALVSTLGTETQKELEQGWCVWYEHNGPQVIGAFTEETAAQQCLKRHPYAKLTKGHPWMQ